MSFWQTVLDHVEAGERVVVALVADHSIHSPGTTGAKLAVFESGNSEGTIGGGIMERRLVDRASEILSGPEIGPQIVTLYHRKDGDGEKSGLICAGYQTNIYLTARPGVDAKTLSAVVAGIAQHGGFLEITKQGLTYRDDIDIEVGAQSRLERSEASDDWRYVERLVNLRRVAIMGGGHCGLALSGLLRQVGYHVSIFDTRPRVATMLENDHSHRKEIVDDFVEAAAMVDFPTTTSVVVMTTALPTDVRALLGALDQPFPFIGVMGSRAKISAIKKELRSEGLDENAIRRIVAPVGLPMRSNTPDEIAVSVAAQLLQITESESPQ